MLLVRRPVPAAGGWGTQHSAGGGSGQEGLGGGGHSTERGTDIALGQSTRPGDFPNHISAGWPTSCQPGAGPSAASLAPHRAGMSQG